MSVIVTPSTRKLIMRVRLCRPTEQLRWRSICANQAWSSRVRKMMRSVRRPFIVPPAPSQPEPGRALLGAVPSHPRRGAGALPGAGGAAARGRPGRAIGRRRVRSGARRTRNGVRPAGNGSCAHGLSRAVGLLHPPWLGYVQHDAVWQADACQRRRVLGACRVGAPRGLGALGKRSVCRKRE